ncbi:MAG TPA: STAS/SEC14 domain-containing protein, partial [Chryseosolibacter sp.]|nr:STAS/SEC14 domain-containing protein [Chryseosolibacter sp.]
MIQISSDSDSNVIYTTSSGTLHKSDYDKLLPLVEDKIRHFGKVRLCFEMTNFSGWTADAMFKDIMFDIRHARDFEKVAMVGDKK